MNQATRSNEDRRLPALAAGLVGIVLLVVAATTMTGPIRGTVMVAGFLAYVVGQTASYGTTTAELSACWRTSWVFRLHMLVAIPLLLSVIWFARGEEKSAAEVLPAVAILGLFLSRGLRPRPQEDAFTALSAREAVRH